MAFMRGIGPLELLIVLFIILLIFGATRLPKLAGSMGKAIREFKKEVTPEGDPSRNTHRRVRSRTGVPRG